MHVNFVRLKEKVQREQERSIEMQNQIFQMMKEVQKFAIEEAQRSARVLGDVSQQLVRPLSQSMQSTVQAEKLRTGNFRRKAQGKA